MVGNEIGGQPAILYYKCMSTPPGCMCVVGDARVFKTTKIVYSI